MSSIYNSMQIFVNCALIPHIHIFAINKKKKQKTSSFICSLFWESLFLLHVCSVQEHCHGEEKQSDQWIAHNVQSLDGL